MKRESTITVGPMSTESEREVLSDPCTRRLVHEVVALCESRDPVDAVGDLSLALAIVYGRMLRTIHGASATD